MTVVAVIADRVVRLPRVSRVSAGKEARNDAGEGEMEDETERLEEEIDEQDDV